MRLKKIVLLLFGLGIGYFLVFSPHGLVKIIQLKWQIRRTQYEMNIMRAKEATLKYEAKLLEQDTSYINKIAKERFGIK